ncbi:MAG: AAA family ATPase [Actinobacteria bacterium]|nr:AAA family ATPase [Actinomycetota bacterium]
MGRFQANPQSPGISLERVERVRSEGLWSARVSQDLRAILYREGDAALLLYVGHHDAAYRWAERRRQERHSVTGEMQGFIAPDALSTHTPGGRSAPVAAEPPTFAERSDAYLLSLGVPDEWLPTVREVRSDDDLIRVCEAIPGDVADRLLSLASGELVTPPAPVNDQQVLDGVVTQLLDPSAVELTDADLATLLEAPLATWIAFLHPSQRDLATAGFRGSAKVTGSAGTGKTVVALHRARHLAQLGRRVLLTSYVSTLCGNIGRGLDVLCTEAERASIDVKTIHQVARSVIVSAGEAPAFIGDEDLRKLIEAEAKGKELPLDTHALVAEWHAIVCGGAVDTWDDYRVANRAGRGVALPEADRKTVWAVLGAVRERLARQGKLDWQDACRRARELLEGGAPPLPYNSVIVDEVQDLSPQALQFVAHIAGTGPDALMVLGDGGQRIFAHRMSLRTAGIEVRGRSRTLRVNYRTTSEIRDFADRILLGRDDLDGESARGACRSVLHGANPRAMGFASAEAQDAFVADEVAAALSSGYEPRDLAVVARTKKTLDRLATALSAAQVDTTFLDPERSGRSADGVQLVTMHRCKGLEFKIVFVVDVTKSQLPLAYVVKPASNDADRAEAIEQERQLLYVSLTRARDELVVTWHGNVSTFLADAVPEALAA